MYLHFSLHAVLDDDTGEGYLLTHRTDPRNVVSDGLPVVELREWLETLPANDLHHYELLDGFVVMEPPASWPHGEIGGEVVHRIKSYLRRHPLGRIFDSSQGFNLPTGDTSSMVNTTPPCAFLLT